MKVKDILLEYYDPADDKMLQAHLSDTRKPHLTFKHLNKLRKMEKLKAIEKANHLKLVSVLYHSAPQQ